MALTGWPSPLVDDDGTGQTGTIVNKDLFDDIEAALEAYLVSGTNPSITPADIIDEVVEARSGEASLDDRIDAVEAQIGVGSVSEATIEALLGARNVLRNGDFEDWNLVPDDEAIGWGFNDPAATGTLARTGIGEGDTFHFGTTQYAVWMNRATGNVYLFQHIIEAADMAAYANVKGQTLSVAAKVKAGSANLARLSVTDGITTTNSSYHTGGGTEEHLTVVHPISSSATVLTVRLEVNAVGNAYFGGVAALFSPLAPSDWQPFSHPRLASDLQRGAVGLADQIMGNGIKKFTEQPLFMPGQSDPTGAAAFVVSARVSGVVDSQFTPIGNTGAGPDTLMTYTLPANSLAVDGDSLRITAWGDFANTANAKQIRFSIAGATIDTESLTGFDNMRWKAVIEVVRFTAALQEISLVFLVGDLTALFTNGSYVTDLNAATDWTLNQVFEVIAQTSTADNDIVQRGMRTEVL